MKSLFGFIALLTPRGLCRYYTAYALSAPEISEAAAALAQTRIVRIASHIAAGRLMLAVVIGFMVFVFWFHTLKVVWGTLFAAGVVALALSCLLWCSVAWTRQILAVCQLTAEQHSTRDAARMESELDSGLGGRDNWYYFPGFSSKIYLDAPVFSHPAVSSRQAFAADPVLKTEAALTAAGFCITMIKFLSG